MQGPPLGVAGLLAQARDGMHRLSPHEAVAAVRRGALLVDTRTEVQRRAQGALPGALVIDRTVLEWRLDPASDSRIPEATDYDREVVVLCRQGYSSSLAAASLRALGLHRATDVVGGVEAWVAAGLPMEPVERVEPVEPVEPAEPLPAGDPAVAGFGTVQAGYASEASRTPTRTGGASMERGSTKHGPVVDEQMQHETEGLVRSGRSTRASEGRETEPVDDYPGPVPVEAEAQPETD